MSRHILVVDPNVPFATMLAQSLQEMVNSQATAVHSGESALDALAAGSYDLVIVDMGLQDIPGPDFVRALRERHPDLPIIIIPLAGDAVPPELNGVEVQGTLPKPFFLPDLPARINAALSGPAQAEPSPPSALGDLTEEILQEMSRLANEIQAKAVLLTRGDQVLAQAGDLPPEEARDLAIAIAESWHTSARVAKILGKEQLRFEQSIGGGEHLLYSLALVEDLLLSALIEGKVPLGIIRHRSRETAEAIRKRLER
ncbi:MAG TPA: response regulator [Thermoflexia bacterium]|nr:response regulator [Thermoflexia bacterium]